MAYGEMILYSAALPCIDPNIVPEYSELKKDGYILFPCDWDEINKKSDIENFGMPMQVLCKSYNLTKMKHDFNMERKPVVVFDTNKILRITDGKTCENIEKNKISPYINKSIKNYYVMEGKQIANLGCDTIVHTYLSQDLMMSCGVFLSSGKHYLLNEKQIDRIEKMVFGLKLKQYCNSKQKIIAYITNEI